MSANRADAQLQDFQPRTACWPTYILKLRKGWR